MRKLDLSDINERGDADFDSLSEIEKNLYVLLLFFLLRDMEGLTHFFSHHPHHVPRLLVFLATVEAPNRRAVSELAEFFRVKAGGSWESDALNDYFLRISSDDNARIDVWDCEYDSTVQEMWKRVKDYVRQQHGIEVE
jgi:hypothetical protein